MDPDCMHTTTPSAILVGLCRISCVLGASLSACVWCGGLRLLLCSYLLQVRARLAAKKKAAETKKKSLAAVAAAEAKARAKKASKKDPTKFNQAPTR